MATDLLLGGKQYLSKIATLIKTQTYLYPRLHSSVSLLLKDLFLGDQKNIPKKFKDFNESILKAKMFDDDSLT